jgi:hypothetical protein
MNGKSWCAAPRTRLRVLLVTKERVLRSGLLRRDQHQAISHPCPGLLKRTCRQLDDRKRLQRSDDSPARHVGPDLQNFPSAVDKKQIDRETHEKRMHHVRRRDDQGMVRRKTGATQEPAIARSRLECRFQLPRNRHACAFVLQGVPAGTLTQKRPEKVGFQEFPGRIIETLMR